MAGILAGKTAMITGGSMGIGGATAELFAEEGAAVVVIARRKEPLDKIVETITKKGGKVLGIQADVTSPVDCKKAFAQAIKTFGSVNILVNNAGMSDLHAIDTTTDEQWNTVIATNQSSVFYYCREAIQHFKTRMEGCIINVSSTNGLRPLTGFAYPVSKSAVNAITRSVALRFAGTKIRCNALCPGGTNTPMLENSVNNPGAEKDEIAMKILQQRNDFSVPLSEPMEQARVILFLASDAASAITGAIIEADKGSFI
jgi:NAD(P)-dependent dehydrogenase (short-subunit alcohol dehydrogenase family)